MGTDASLEKGKIQPDIRFNTGFASLWTDLMEHPEKGEELIDRIITHRGFFYLTKNRTSPEKLKEKLVRYLKRRGGYPDFDRKERAKAAKYRQMINFLDKKGDGIILNALKQAEKFLPEPIHSSLSVWAVTGGDFNARGGYGNEDIALNLDWFYGKGFWSEFKLTSILTHEFHHVGFKKLIPEHVKRENLMTVLDDVNKGTRRTNVKDLAKAAIMMNLIGEGYADYAAFINGEHWDEEYHKNIDGISDHLANVKKSLNMLNKVTAENLVSVIKNVKKDMFGGNGPRSGYYAGYWMVRHIAESFGQDPIFKVARKGDFRGFVELYNQTSVPESMKLILAD